MKIALGEAFNFALNRKMQEKPRKGFTDIRAGGWIRYLPRTWQPYANLMRLDRPVGWWLLLLPSWWSILAAVGGARHMSGYDWYLFVLFFVGAVVMRGAGCVVNDLWDRDLDARVERTRWRPLASGEVKPWQAVFFLFFLSFIGLVILVQTSSLAIWLGLASMLLVVAYPYMKRITWWPQAFLGITFNMGALIGWAAVKGDLGMIPFLLYAGGFFWTLGYDTIYAHQDKLDDQLIGVRSTALLFGRRSKKWVALFYALCWGCLSTAVFMQGADVLSFGLLFLPLLHFMLQLVTWRMDDPASCLKIFKANRDAGLLFLLSFAALGI